MPKTLDDDQIQILIAFKESFELRTTGAWAGVEAGMRDDYGIEDPETELETLFDYLSGNT